MGLNSFGQSTSSADTSIVKSYTVASGETIAAGNAVELLSDGTVRLCKDGRTMGTRVNLSSGSQLPVTLSLAILDSTKFAVAYIGNSNYPYVAIASVSGTSISSVGNEVAIESAAGSALKVFAVSSTKIVCVWRRNSTSYMVAAVGTVSGTTVSFAAPQVVCSAAGTTSSNCALLRKESTTMDSLFFLAHYASLSNCTFCIDLKLDRSSGSFSALTAGTATVGDATYAVNSVVGIDSLKAGIFLTKNDSSPATKFGIRYSSPMFYSGNAGGTSLSSSTVPPLTGNNGVSINAIALDSENIVALTADSGGSDTGGWALYLIRATDSYAVTNFVKTKATLGVYSTSSARAGIFAAGKDKIYVTAPSDQFYFCSAYINNEGINAVGRASIEASSPMLSDAAMLSSDRAIVAYNWSSLPQARVVPIRKTFDGIAVSAGSAGSTVNVVISGKATGLSGLTPGTMYYLDSATASLTNNSRSGEAVGYAISATELVLSGYNIADNKGGILAT
jgi:hypothetical protein